MGSLRDHHRNQKEAALGANDGSTAAYHEGMERLHTPSSGAVGSLNTQGIDHMASMVRAAICFVPQLIYALTVCGAWGMIALSVNEAIGNPLGLAYPEAEKEAVDAFAILIPAVFIANVFIIKLTRFVIAFALVYGPWLGVTVAAIFFGIGRPMATTQALYSIELGEEWLSFGIIHAITLFCFFIHYRLRKNKGRLF